MRTLLSRTSILSAMLVMVLLSSCGKEELVEPRAHTVAAPQVKSNSNPPGTDAVDERGAPPPGVVISDDGDDISGSERTRRRGAGR